MPISAQLLIQSLVAPVIMISACGLLCLALYNRLAAIVSRARTFNKERHELQITLAAMEAGDHTTSKSAELHGRLVLLTEQTSQIMRRAAQVRNALQCLLFSILCMLGCSLATGLSNLQGRLMFAYWAAVGFFLVGICAIGFGLLLAMWELRMALTPAATECLNAGMEEPPAGMDP